ncbi:MAG: CAP domain-containing protein [Candidatus Velthaea sp.]
MRVLALSALAMLALVGAGTTNGHAHAPIALDIVRPVSPSVRVNEAAALVADINVVRLSAGLGSLAVDDRLSRAALHHARDMASRNYFGHESPDGRSLIDRLGDVGFTWHVAAENIALNSDETHAHQALLDSPGHRANMLDPRVRLVGVAALNVGQGSTLYVEDFAL